MIQAVQKLYFDGQDGILVREVGLSRNNDSPTLTSGFNYCAEGLSIGVFTQPGSCVDGSVLASVYLMFLRIGWVLSCVRPVDAAFAGRWP
jgi:hypothetical protein